MEDIDQCRIVVTGIGMITSLGIGVVKNFDRIAAGQSGITPVETFQYKDYRSRWYSHIKDIDLNAGLSEKEQRRTDRCYKLLRIAADDAMTDANLTAHDITSASVGLYLGSIMAGDCFAHESHAATLKQKTYPRHHSYLYPKHVYADLLARHLKINGPKMVISTACTASALAIGAASEGILSGQVDFAFAGGSDPLSEYIFAGFHNMRNISQEPCAPFSTPEGMTLGEGAGFLILERRDRALERGARLYAELLGYGMTADAIHPTSPDFSGESHKALIEKAMKHSGVSHKDIDYINLHGTGTKANDKTEALGLNLVFDDAAKDIKVSSIKGAVGHILGGAGVVEAAITVMSLYRQELVPNVGFKGPRDACDLNVVETSKPAAIEVAMSNNYAFGGNNACLVFSKSDRSLTKKPRRVTEQSVVISGIGFVSPYGAGKENLSSTLSKDDAITIDAHGIAYFPFSDSDLQHTGSFDARRADRLGKLMLSATQRALSDANFSPEHLNLNELGIISGTAHSHLTSNLAFNEMIVHGKPQLANPIDFANSVTNAGCGLASINLGAKGCNIALSTGHMSGLQSLALAYELVKSGRESKIICGGADALDPFILQSMAHAFKTSASADESLLNLILNGETEQTLFGEGGGYFVIETEASAKARGAKVYCKIDGYSIAGSSNADTLCGDVPGLLEQSMRHALSHADHTTQDIAHIIRADLFLRHQHIGELEAIKKLFGSAMSQSSYSKYFGVSAALAPLSLAHYLVSEKHAKPVGSTMINAMSFGGNAVSLILSPA